MQSWRGGCPQAQGTPSLIFNPTDRKKRDQIMVPRGQLTIAEAIKRCEELACRLRETDPVEGSLICGDNQNKQTKLILEEALTAGELIAALVRRADGVLITIPTSSWRRDHHEPMAFFGEEQELDPPTTPFGYAALGRDIPAVADAHGNLTDWGTPVIAEFDLAVWLNADQLPPAPMERPADWPVTPETLRRDATEIELSNFMMGYALGVIECSDKPPRRDDHRKVVAKEFYATTDQVDKAFRDLPARFKNHDRSKGKKDPK
jgi:hypothetical protein